MNLPTDDAAYATLPDPIIAIAREWLRENYADIDGWSVAQLGTQSVVRAVEARYDGGWFGFVMRNS